MSLKALIPSNPSLLSPELKWHVCCGLRWKKLTQTHTCCHVHRRGWLRKKMLKKKIQDYTIIVTIVPLLGVMHTLDLDIDSCAVSCNEHSRRLLSMFNEMRNSYFFNLIDISISYLNTGYFSSFFSSKFSTRGGELAQPRKSQKPYWGEID